MDSTVNELKHLHKEVVIIATPADAQLPRDFRMIVRLTYVERELHESFTKSHGRTEVHL